MKKRLVIVSISLILLISMSFVFAEITGEVTSIRTAKSVPTSVSEQESDSSSTLTTETRTGLEPTPIRKSLSQFSRSSSLGTAWTQVDALGGGTCYVREASSGLRSLFRRSI